MTRYPLYRRLGRPQGWSGWVQKISPPPRFDPRTVQLVASRYTDYTILAHFTNQYCFIYQKILIFVLPFLQDEDDEGWYYGAAHSVASLMICSLHLDVLVRILVPLNRDMADTVTNSDKQLVLLTLGSMEHLFCPICIFPHFQQMLYMPIVQTQVITNVNMCCRMTMLIIHPLCLAV
jgi:hypothetical protein